MVWLLLAYLLRLSMRVTAIVLGVGVAVARVYLGTHNPLDVICGAALGIAIGVALNLVLGVPRTHPPAKSSIS